MSKLYSLLSTHGGLGNDAREYELHELSEPYAWFHGKDRYDHDPLPISYAADAHYTLTERSERYHWLLQSMGGGIIFWGQTRKEVITFLERQCHRKIVAEERA